MMGNNPYYNPEEMGLVQVGQVEYSSGNWEFDTRVVWRDTNNNFYTARDSGCSCPVPFEDYTTIESLDRLDIDELRREIQNDLKPNSETSIAEAQDILHAIEIMVREARHD